MKLTYAISLSFVCTSLAAEPAPPLKLPQEQQVWAAMVARFASGPTVKAGAGPNIELAASGLRNDPKGGGSVAVTVEKASGHVIEVTSNGAALIDDEVASFTLFQNCAR